ncbi:transposase [Dietzia timorensis]|uniref:transposase n=1 Tax=Dietzia timorensis TaxID=499555 RepID=UPI003AAAFDE6
MPSLTCAKRRGNWGWVTHCRQVGERSKRAPLPGCSSKSAASDVKATRSTGSAPSSRCDPARLTERQWRRFNDALAADPRHEELFLAWQIAHELRQAYHHKDLPAGRSAAEKILATLPSCPIPEIARLGRTLRKWKDSFLAYWTTDRSNNGEPKRSTASSNSTGAWPALPQPRQLPPADAPHRRRLRT